MVEIIFNSKWKSRFSLTTEAQCGDLATLGRLKEKTTKTYCDFIYGKKTLVMQFHIKEKQKKSLSYNFIIQKTASALFIKISIKYSKKLVI